MSIDKEYFVCAICGNQTAHEIVSDLEVQVPEGIVFIKDDRHMSCTSSDCKEEFYTNEQLNEHNKKVSEARSLYRNEHGIIHPEDVVRIRKKYSFSQTKLEKILGLGPKTVIRWEKGHTNPSVAADNLLRIIDRFPEVLFFLAALRLGEDINSIAYIENGVSNMLLNPKYSPWNQSQHPACMYTINPLPKTIMTTNNTPNDQSMCFYLNKGKSKT